jgi:hypothetical protein
MNFEKLLEWGAIILVAIFAIRWGTSLLSGLSPLEDQQPGIGGWTNITPVTGPIFVTGGYNGGWNRLNGGNGPYGRPLRGYYQSATAYLR